jgi:hypothetical protein
MRKVHSKSPRIWQPIPSQVTLWQGCDSGGVLPRHAHEEFQIVFSGSVAYEFSYKRSNTVLPPQQLGLIQSGETHASQSEDATGQALRLMFFSPEILMNTAAMLEESESPVLPNLVVSDAVTVQQFLNLHTTLSKDVSQLECETLIFAFLTQLILRCAENPPVLSELREPLIVPIIRDYLRENYAENTDSTGTACQSDPGSSSARVLSGSRAATPCVSNTIPYCAG